MRGIKHDFRCGDRVFDPLDPRHSGDLILIKGGVLATVRWDRDDGHSSFYSVDVPLRNLRKVTQEEKCVSRSPKDN